MFFLLITRGVSCVWEGFSYRENSPYLQGPDSPNSAHEKALVVAYLLIFPFLDLVSYRFHTFIFNESITYCKDLRIYDSLIQFKSK